MNRKVWMSVLVASALFLAGCGGAKEEAKKEEAAPAAPVDEATAATVTGKILFTGQKPLMKAISMEDKPECARQHATAPRSEEVVVNQNGTLRNVFVWVKAGLPNVQWPVPATAAALDQKTCVYKPHVFGVMANQDIDIMNSDPTNHNIHPLPKINREWNESQPPKGDKKVKQFPRQEVMIAVKCNVHPWMRSYIGVVSHPFFAVTGEDGTYTLKGLPPGEYTVEAWHEKYGAQETKVTVGPKESKATDFNYKG